jgi:hypothetical protein
MGLVRQERLIDGSTFSVTQLPAMRGVKMLNRLFRVLGPPAARALGGVNVAELASRGLAGLDVGALAEAVPLLADRLTEAELEALVRELLETATIDGRPLMPTFDLTMQGRVGTVLKLVGFALEVNYGSFFDVLGGAARAATTASHSGGSSTSPRPGPSGVSSSSGSPP